MRKFVVVLAIALVVAVALVALRRCDSGRDAREGSTAGGSATSANARNANTAATARAPADGLSMLADAGARDRRIAGRVVFGGKPFANAQVTAHVWNGLVTPTENGAPLERKSAADGTFDLGLLPPASFEVVASAPGKVAAVARVQLANPNARPDPEELVLELQACETWIAGNVRDAAGGPIVHAQVRRDGIVGVETDAQGTYELCVPHGEVIVEYSADGYGTVLLTITAELRTRRDVVLVPEAIVQGIVIDEAGTPVAGAHVAVVPAQFGPERPAQRSATTDGEGRFRVARVMPGRVRVWAFAEGLSTDGTTEVMAMVGTSPDVTLTLVHRASVSGRVMQRGQPVAGVEVVAVRTSPAARSWPGYSQADGSFVLARVPPGDFVFTTSQHRVTSPTELHVGTTPITGVVIEVEAIGSISGRITRGGRPVEGARVCCVERPTGFDVASDANGEYVFEKVDPGTYQLSAQSGRLGAFGIRKEPVTVALGEAKRVDLDMPFAATITGTIVDEAGAGVVGAIVKFKNPTDEDSCRAVADERGRFRCAGMTGGTTYAASVYRRAGNEPVMPTPFGKPYPVIDLKNGDSELEDVTIVVVVRRGGVRGRVVDTKGAPIVDAQVKASTGTFSSWLKLPTEVTDVDGNFAFRELGGTSYAIEARSPDGGTGTATGVPVDGAPITITVTRPGAIEGALVGYAGTPAVFAAPTTPFAEHTLGSVSGATYRVGALAPGRYVVDVQTTFEGDIREVEVRSGETTRADFTAKGRGAIEASVNDFITKAPIANVRCHAVLAIDGVQGMTSWDLATAPTSDASGRLRIDPAPAGNVIVACKASSRYSSPQAEVRVTAGATARVQLWSVTRTNEAWPFIGLDFDWRVVAPRIASVSPNGPAAAAGLAPGDLVVAVDDGPIVGLDGQGVLLLILEHPIGAKVPITIERGGQKRRFELEVRPQP